MKQALALAALFAFCAAVSLATGNPGKAGGKSTEATITKLDLAGKSMVVKTADGKETRRAGRTPRPFFKA
jgi:hypothetical protein